MLTRRQTFPAIAAALATPALTRRAFADSWPSKPIHAIVPFSAGSTADIIPRIVFDPMSAALGQTIVVENHGGAGGSVGAAQVARAEPDGYTLLVNASAHTAAPALYPNLSYDAAKDFSGVAMFGNTPNVTVVAPARGFKTLGDLVAYAKAHPGVLSFASAGVGSATHLSAERLRMSAGFQATHVPFRGGPEGLTEVMTGRVDFYCCGISSALSFIRAKQLIPLAVSTAKRASLLPDVPTTLELGYKDSDYNFWTGLLVPSKTPREIVDRLYAEATKALAKPEIAEKLAKQGVDPFPLTPAEFDALIRKEIASNMTLIKAAGIKTN
ncbi:MAG TPA: tripartite tricarboxylate transporter substrate binding protein [Pseudolabrys sp.]|nr:tripartite tricarboxylate transporter substrate binding protein [Pseudolabrys sp.]